MNLGNLIEIIFSFLTEKAWFDKQGYNKTL